MNDKEFVLVSKENFYKIWKDSSKDAIINQYYYDYQYQRELANDIMKAIEYIKERYDGEVLTHTFDKDNVKELYDILKGSDKE